MIAQDVDAKLIAEIDAVIADFRNHSLVYDQIKITPGNIQYTSP